METALSYLHDARAAQQCMPGWQLLTFGEGCLSHQEVPDNVQGTVKMGLLREHDTMFKVVEDMGMDMIEFVQACYWCTSCNSISNMSAMWVLPMVECVCMCFQLLKFRDGGGQLHARGWSRNLLGHSANLGFWLLLR